MQKSTVRYIILVIILVIFSLEIILLKHALPEPRQGPDIASIPLNIEKWRGREIPVDKRIKDNLQTESIIVREYRKGYISIWLAIVYYKDNRVSSGLTNACSVSDDSLIFKNEGQKIYFPTGDVLPVNRVILGNRMKQVMVYYFETSGLKTSNYAAMRWKTIVNKLNLESNSCALVKLSCMAKKNPEETSKILNDFIMRVSPLISKNLFYSRNK